MISDLDLDCGPPLPGCPYVQAPLLHCPPHCGRLPRTDLTPRLLAPLLPYFHVKLHSCKNAVCDCYLQRQLSLVTTKVQRSRNGADQSGYTFLLEVYIAVIIFVVFNS